MPTRGCPPFQNGLSQLALPAVAKLWFGGRGVRWRRTLTRCPNRAGAGRRGGQVSISVGWSVRCLAGTPTRQLPGLDFAKRGPGHRPPGGQWPFKHQHGIAAGARRAASYLIRRLGTGLQALAKLPAIDPGRRRPLEQSQADRAISELKAADPPSCKAVECKNRLKAQGCIVLGHGGEARGGW